MDSVMPMDHQEVVEEDPFLRFIEYARSMLSPEDGEALDPKNGSGALTNRPSWNWIASRILKTCTAYSSGVTPAILLSDLSQVPIFTSIFHRFLCRHLFAEKMHVKEKKSEV